jgi:hypothetical protein
MGMITKYKTGDEVEVKVSRTGDWIPGTIHRPMAASLYQVSTATKGFLTVKEYDIRKPK